MCTKKEIIEVLTTYYGFTFEEAENKYKKMDEKTKKSLIDFRNRQVNKEV